LDLKINYRQARGRMVTDQLQARGVSDERVLDAFRRIPRDEFVDPALAAEAYSDRALPISHGQTISQPYMVGVMTQYLAPSSTHRVLEVGTGSGYQAAILSLLAGHVYTIERHAKLTQRAQATHRRLGLTNISYRVGDGSIGWNAHAPYDGILVTAGAPRIPSALLKQLGDSGRIVVPTGSRGSQILTIVTRRGEAYDQETAVPCVFVPLLGEEGWQGD
jgi:protein-L-isoaspartate(D-aspartate) O-methyltransferase